MKKILLAVLFLVFARVSFSQEISKELSYPINCTTTQDKIEFCYIAQQKLQDEHNAKGKDFREGKITEEEWREYLSKEFDPKQSIVMDNLIKCKVELKKSTKYEVDLNALSKNITAIPK